MIKRFVIISLLVFVAINLNAQKKVRIDFLPKQNKSVKPENIQTLKEGIRISEKISSLNIEVKESKQGTYLYPSAAGMSKSYNVGNPNLPVISRLIEIPLDAKVEFKLISYDESLINLSDYDLISKIIPAQPSLSKSDDPDKAFFHKNDEVYSKNEFFKREIVTFEDKGYLRNKHLGYIEISPFEYNPVTNTIRVINNIEIDITFIKDDTKSLKTKVKASPYFDNLPLNTLNQVEETKSLIEGPIKYVIVSDRMFEETLQPFIEWKTIKGFNVITAFTDDLNVGNTTTSIKAYLQDLYENPSDGIAPTFVLFVGDVDQVPSFDGIKGSFGYHVSDLYYCEYTGDMLPEVFYGRFSAETVEELQAQIDKTLEVEKYEMPNPAYLNNVVLVAGVDAGSASVYCNGFVNYTNQYYTNTENGINSYFYLYNDDSGVMKSNATGASASMRSYISAGVSIANYSAHCGSNGWSDPKFSSDSVETMTNEHKYPLIIGNCCESNMFHMDDCFGETLMKASGKGAVGYIGGSDDTLWDEDLNWGVGLTEPTANPTYENSGLGAYDRFFHLNGESKEDWFITQAQIIVAGNLAVEASTSNYKDYYWEIYHLMGDPSLVPFVKVPQILTASYNSEVIVGSTEFQVITEEDAYVAISLNGKLLDAKLADNSGIVNLNFNPISDVGTLKLVITKQNRQPKIVTLSTTQTIAPLIAVEEITYSDELGNANNTIEFDEDILIDLKLKNFSDTYDATNVNANFLLLNDIATIIDDIEAYGDMAAGLSVIKESAFKIGLNDSIKDQDNLSFDIRITGENNLGSELTWLSTHNVKINAPSLEIKNFVIDDATGNGNGILDPGETVDILLTVENNGHASISGLSGLISTLNDNLNYITLNTSTVNDVTINYGSYSVFTFNVTADAGITNGAPVYFRFEIIDNLYGAYSVIADRECVVDIQMNTNSVVVNSGINFYDTGGESSNYSDYENDTITFIPANPGELVRANFLNFNIESHTSCDYDYLKVYDGLNNSATLIGKYCGTNSPGKITASNPDGALTFVFHSDQNTTELGWEAQISCKDNFEYQLLVKNNDGPLSGASVSFNGEIKTTGADGTVTFTNIIEGVNIPLLISADQYIDYTGLVNLFENTNEEVLLSKTKYNIGFKILDEVERDIITDAEIDFLGQNVLSDQSGKYYFKDLDYSLNQDYIISKEGFGQIVGQVDIIKDQIITIYMDSRLWDIIFSVKDDNDLPLENVSVVLNTMEQITNSSGEATFNNIVETKGMSYDLSKEGYESVNGSFDLDNDTTINIKMTLVNAINDLNKQDIKIYPNPSAGVFSLEIPESDFKEYNIKIYDVIGNLVYSKKVDGINGIKEQIDITEKSKGMYLISIESGKGLVLSRRILIQ